MTVKTSAGITLVGMRALFIQLSIALLTLIVPEIWKDTFEGLRRSQYWRFIQIAVIIWIAVVVWIAVFPSVIYWANRNRTFAVIIASAVGAVIFGTAAWQGLSGSRLARPLVNGRSDIAKSAGLKIVIALPGINEEKDLIASADGATIALFNDSPSVLKDIHEILRFPTLKSAEVLDKYKSRASITGGGKPGSDYMVIEIPELRPTQRVVLQVAFAEKQKVTSVEAWASQYGYAKDYIQVQQGFMGKERRDIIAAVSPPTAPMTVPGEIGWNFSSFLGMSSGAFDPNKPVPQFRIQTFQSFGRNIWSSTITKIEGYIEIDRSGERLPLLINKEGKPVDLAQMPAIEIDERIAVVCYFTQDRSL